MTDSVDIKPVPLGLLNAMAQEAPEQASPGRPQPAPGTSANGQYNSRLLVDPWLRDRGQECRVKTEPDGYGRTVYVLAKCPFDPTHGDPDACIMQDPDGKMSAKCLHNSCQGRGWQDFKKVIGKPAANHYDPPLNADFRGA